jgi:hypothetical protein
MSKREKELEYLRKHQVKSKWYYIFWAVCAVAVVSGQVYVGTGYRIMAEEFSNYVRNANFRGN